MDIRLRSWGGAAGLLLALAGCDGVVNNDDVIIALTERVSVAPGKVQANNESRNPRVSANGRFVVFQSRASNLVTPGPANGKFNIYVVDFSKGSVVRVSVGVGGADPNLDCVNPVVSDDGRFVAFETSARNLITPDDLNGIPDIYIWDRKSGAIELVSADTGGAPIGGSAPAITPDGALVAFESAAPAQQFNAALPADGAGFVDIFVRDVQGGTTDAVTLNYNASAMANQTSARPSISAVGALGPTDYYVSFESTAGDLDGAGGPSTFSHIYRRSMFLGTTVRVSSTPLGGPGGNNSNNSSISRDGRFVAFASDATDLVLGDFNGQTDVFVRDLGSAAGTVLASVHSSGTQGAGASNYPRISGDGSSVLFQSAATNLVDDDTNSAEDVFVHSFATGLTQRVSIRSHGLQTPVLTTNQIGDLSADGRWAVFNSDAGTLVDGDNNGVHDVFIRGKLQ